MKARTAERVKIGLMIFTLINIVVLHYLDKQEDALFCLLLAIFCVLVSIEKAIRDKENPW